MASLISRHTKKKIKFWIGSLLHKHAAPNAIIVGVQKSGTSSLFRYITRHPRIRAACRKEIHYFDKWIHYGRSLRWYESHFWMPLRVTEEYVYIEATPKYLYVPEALKEIKKSYPDVRIIVILRDPVERAYSAWNMYRTIFEKKEKGALKLGEKPGTVNHILDNFMKGRDVFPDLDECLDIEERIMREHPDQQEPSIIRRGYYATQLKQLYALFPKEQVLVIGFNDLRENTASCVSRVYDFLQLPHPTAEQGTYKVYNKNTYTSKIDAETKKRLEAYYVQEKEAVEELIGTTINW